MNHVSTQQGRSQHPPALNREDVHPSYRRVKVLGPGLGCPSRGKSLSSGPCWRSHGVSRIPIGRYLSSFPPFLFLFCNQQRPNKLMLRNAMDGMDMVGVAPPTPCRFVCYLWALYSVRIHGSNASGLPSDSLLTQLANPRNSLLERRSTLRCCLSGEARESR